MQLVTKTGMNVLYICMHTYADMSVGLYVIVAVFMHGLTIMYFMPYFSSFTDLARGQS